jgi:hypothetical protein
MFMQLYRGSPHSAKPVRTLLMTAGVEGAREQHRDSSCPTYSIGPWWYLPLSARIKRRKHRRPMTNYLCPVRPGGAGSSAILDRVPSRRYYDTTGPSNNADGGNVKNVLGLTGI